MERTKVEIYAQLANALFENLFGLKLVQKVSESTELFGEFMVASRDLEQALNETFPRSETYRPFSVMELMRTVNNSGILSKQELKDLHELRHVRNAMARPAKSDTAHPRLSPAAQKVCRANQGTHRNWSRLRIVCSICARFTFCRKPKCGTLENPIARKRYKETL